jgi:hypothetical protein
MLSCCEHGNEPFDSIKLENFLTPERFSSPQKRLLFLTKHHDMEAYWERRGIVPSTLDVTLGGGEWLASHPGSFTPNERPTGIHWIGA